MTERVARSTWAYFYFMKDDPVLVRETAPQHARYWSAESSAAGPFVDRSGGLIVFESPDEQAAKALVAGDPFQREDVVERSWLKAWEPAAGR